MKSLSLKLATGLLLAGMIGLAVPSLNAATATDAASEGAVSLFSIDTAKGEIVVGLTGSELAPIAGPGEDGMAAIARVIASEGRMSVWQFAVRKGADGALEQAPYQRISLLDHEPIRIEPYTTPVRVVASK